MPDLSTAPVHALSFLAVALALRAADALYYRDSQRILRLLKLEGTARKGERYYQRFDALFALFPFLWSWCDILAANLAAAHFAHPALYVLLVLFVGTRFRALQEAAHTATHSGLCKSRPWQWALSNVFFQYPCFKPDMHHRYTYHVLDHHHHANEPGRDPNVTRFISVGFVPGLTRAQFHWKLLHPLTAAGFAETFRAMAINSLRNQRVSNLAVRVLVVAGVVAGFTWAFGPKGLLLGFLLPLVTAYPLYSWLSVLAEHRWYVHCDEEDRVARECINGRPTDYSGPLGWLVKHAIFPATDHYHLAHSIYPHLRWNYVRAVDLALKKKDPRYARHLSHGLFWSSTERPSALSELRDRLTATDDPELAGWARELAIEAPRVTSAQAHARE
ncbi:fatty acid desaturase [Corallococcus coralloides]|uniref:fatty acid desaturase n=1 Tax=Corallococcus coralloides TaxID=184914 RepID=UPI00384AB5F8